MVIYQSHYMMHGQQNVKFCCKTCSCVLLLIYTEVTWFSNCIRLRSWEKWHKFSEIGYVCTWVGARRVGAPGRLIFFKVFRAKKGLTVPQIADNLWKNSFIYGNLIRGNKMPTRCKRWFLLQILSLAQDVSGTTMPIIRSSRVLYRCLLPVVFGALVFKLSVWCGAEGYVSGLWAAALSTKYHRQQTPV